MTLSTDFLAILPEAGLTLLGIIVLLLDTLSRGAYRKQLSWVTAIGFFLLALITALLLFPLPLQASTLQLGGMIRLDVLGSVLRVLFMVAAGFTALLSADVDGLSRKGEFFALLIAAVIGMNFMAISADLIMLYLALETTSISAYVLTGFLADEKRSTEAGMKYFLFGAVTSSVMLYGFSLLYGFTGSTSLNEIFNVLASGKVSFAAVSAISLFILTGVGFKLSVFPFHFWSPDVYEGAPTPVTSFISTASKAAAFAVLIRLFAGSFLAAGSEFWMPLIVAIAVVTTSLGNLVALAQKNIKRLLAYSSIAHAGYTLMAFTAIQYNGAQQDAVAAIVYYLITYVLTNMAAFAAVILVAKATGSDDVAAFSGLNKRHAGLSLVMLVAFLSLSGIPPLAGFIGKFFIFLVLVKANLIWLAIVLAINSLIALYYYLLVLNTVYNRPVPENVSDIKVSLPYKVALVLLVVGILVFGTLFPYYDSLVSAASAIFLHAAGG